MLLLVRTPGTRLSQAAEGATSPDADTTVTLESTGTGVAEVSGRRETAFRCGSRRVHMYV